MEGRGQAPRLDGRVPVQGRRPRAGLPQVRLRLLRRAPREIRGRARRRRLGREQIARASSTTSTSTPATTSSTSRRRSLAYLAQHAKGCPQDGQPYKTIGQLIDEAMDLIDRRQPASRARLRGSTTATTSTSAASASCSTCSTRPASPGAGASKAPATSSARSTSTSSRSSHAPRASAAASSSPRRSVVRVLVEVLEPTHGRIYDPACGSGGMFVQAEKFLEAHQRGQTASVDLRPGAQRAHLAPGPDEPRHPRSERQPRPSLGRHLRPRPPPGHRRRTT